MGSGERVVVVGGGIVGLAVAWTLCQGGARVIVLEKEGRVGVHQSGRNSGVIHSGVYYKPGSAKAKLCRRGREMLVAFCDEHGVEFEMCGKVVVAVGQKDVPRLEDVARRGRANGIDCELVDGDGLRQLEPHAAGVSALHVRDAGIVDFVGVCEKLAELVREGGGRVEFGACVEGVELVGGEVVVQTNVGEFVGDRLVNCAGLQSDRVARMTGVGNVGAQIVPFRGEYYELVGEARRLCRNLIYPVADPRLPFLGVHATRMIERDDCGQLVECGPNAVLAFAREGYAMDDVDWVDLAQTLGYGGFWRLSRRWWRVGVSEFVRSMDKGKFVKAVQRILPDVRDEDLRPRRAGVRAQAVFGDGSMADDFVVTTDGRVVNVINAPSPAATSCLAIGQWIVGKGF